MLFFLLLFILLSVCFLQTHQRIVRCWQHWTQSWAANRHTLSQLVPWWQTFHLTFTINSDLPDYLQNKETRHPFSHMTLLWNYHHWMCLLSELWFASFDRVTHTCGRQSVQSSPISFPEAITDFWLLWCQHSGSRLLWEDLGKPRISHQRTHHVLTSASWMPENARKDPFILVPLFQTTLCILNNSFIK